MTLPAPHLPYSDFVVYVDESGDHSLTSVNPRYPLFVLSFCVLRTAVYNEQVAPALRRLKFAAFGHDMVVLHESDIRRRRGAFAHLMQAPREQFLRDLTDTIAAADFQLVAAVIDKTRFIKKAAESPGHAYHLALAMGLQSLFELLCAAGQQGSLTHVVCEARGAQEDMELELEFRRICDQAGYAQRGVGLDIVIADKKTNSEGLQLADLTARPIGLSVLRPEQPNRAAEVLEPKFYRHQAGGKLGAGLKIYP
jgi:hypothetical protein